MSSPQYYDFVANVWKELSEDDRLRMAELWKGFEQTVAAAYQKFFEFSFNVNIDKQFTYSDERWLLHQFNDNNSISRAATFKTKEDLSLGINLSVKHLIKLSWDNRDPIEISLMGYDPYSTSIDEIVSIINSYAGFRLVKKDITKSLLEFTSPTTGTNSNLTFYQPSIPEQDASEIILGLLPSNMPYSLPIYTYCYKSEYPNLRSVPVIQNAIRDESLSIQLKEGIDYIISEGEFQFKLVPPSSMWAKRNLFDEEWPWNNFGYLIDIYQENSDRYLEIIKGLWFAFWTGPKPSNLKRSLYLLFGLPTAPYDGYISHVDPLRIDVTSYAGKVTSYSVPDQLEPIVISGQKVKMFDPLVSGIDVFDKVNYPGFVAEEVGRSGIQRFLLEEATLGTNPETDESRALRMLEEYTFLPQISVNAFIRQDINLSNVRLFLDAIKPTVKTYLFQVIVGTFRDELSLEEKVSWDLDIDVTPNIGMNETTNQPSSVLSDHETTVNPGLCVDSEGILMREAVEIEVRTFGILIDFFEA